MMYDKVAVYAGTRNLYEQMYVCLKSLLVNNAMDRVYLLIEDDEYPYTVPENVIPVNVSEQDSSQTAHTVCSAAIHQTLSMNSP